MLAEEMGPGQPVGWTYITILRNLYTLGDYCTTRKEGNVNAALEWILQWQTDEGYIRDFHFIDEGKVSKTLKVELKYDESGLNAISGLKRISKPGRRVYSKFTDIPKIMSGLGVSVVSTSQGLMTDRKARAQKIGGEILCAIW